MQKSQGSIMISLLVFTVVGIAITTTAVLLTLDAISKSAKLQTSSTAVIIAESGIENAILNLLRNPSYAGEEMRIDAGRAIVTVTGSNPKVITSVGSVESFKRTIQVQVSRQNGALVINSWEEIK